MAGLTAILPGLQRLRPTFFPGVFHASSRPKKLGLRRPALALRPQVQPVLLAALSTAIGAA
jgi:hypothetical protein